MSQNVFVQESYLVSKETYYTNLENVYKNLCDVTNFCRFSCSFTKLLSTHDCFYFFFLISVLRVVKS
jgi:hypothetical protein